jgi:quercetin dioxygenase-like cupin family protein
MSDDFAIVQYADLVDAEPFTESQHRYWKLTGALGATDVRVNAVELDPGESLTLHAHERQEELYVAVTDGQVEIEGTVHDVPEGSVVRLGPDPIRGLCNHTDETHVWVLFGAPPVGTIEDFGEYVLPEEADG